LTRSEGRKEIKGREKDKHSRKKLSLRKKTRLYQSWLKSFRGTIKELLRPRKGQSPLIVQRDRRT
jgi:hypothetical protein